MDATESRRRGAIVRRMRHSEPGLARDSCPRCGERARSLLP